MIDAEICDLHQTLSCKVTSIINELIDAFPVVFQLMRFCNSSRAQNGFVTLLIICSIAFINHNTHYLKISYDHEFTEKGKRIVIYDFDQTLTVKPLYGMLKNEYSAFSETEQLAMISKLKMIDIFGGDERMQRLNSHLKFLKSHNVDIAILSFGWHQVINYALKQMNISQYFDTIIGRNELKISQIITPNINGDGNNNELSMKKVKSIKYDFKKYNANNILFVDDSWMNMKLASRNNVCRVFDHNFQHGLNATDLEIIESYVVLP